ncbi:MAG: alpha/beta fold hydrolase [Candidatus Margulisbacteria bacterium]|nr:alpha/beta fold hydrolase [Candidatus Margulisiibacteriota bacterium]
MTLYLLILLSSFIYSADFFSDLLYRETSLNVSSTGHTYYYQHPSSNKVVLLIHGYTSNPSETINLGNYLYMQGFDVFGVRLEGHGTSPEDLCKTTWQQWYSSADQAFLYLKSKYDKVYIFGVSTGALTGLKLAENHDVAGLVCAGTFIYPKSIIKFGYRLYPIAKFLHIPLGYVRAPIPKERQHITYTRNPLDTTMQLMYFVNDVKPKLNKITCPVLLMHCPKDDVADPKSAQYVYDHIKSADKKLVWAGKEHSFLIDKDEKIYKQITEWYKSISR